MNPMNRRNLFKMMATLTGGLLLRKAVPPLEALQLLAEKTVSGPGMQVRYIRSYDPATHGAITRMDVLHSWATLYPESACRIAG